VAATNGSFEAEENLGVALLEAGRPGEAMAHFERVIAVRPGASAEMIREQNGYAAVAQLYLGTYEQQHGHFQQALEHYEAVLRLARDFSAENGYQNVPPVLLKIKATALANMGYTYYALGESGQSAESFQDALWLEPHDARAWVGFGLAQQAAGRLSGAVQAYSKAAELKPSDTNLLLLAQALEQSGRPEEAQSAKQRAAVLSRNLPEAQTTVNRMLAHSH
jgi:tetratricopeptide (TPR) repeat protein